MLLDNAPSDRHYQFMRYALYDRHNELIAHALQIHDITDQMLDEGPHEAEDAEAALHKLHTASTSLEELQEMLDRCHPAKTLLAR